MPSFSCSWDVFSGLNHTMHEEITTKTSLWFGKLLPQWSRQNVQVAFGQTGKIIDVDINKLHAQKSYRFRFTFSKTLQETISLFMIPTLVFLKKNTKPNYVPQSPCLHPWRTSLKASRDTQWLSLPTVARGSSSPAFWCVIWGINQRGKNMHPASKRFYLTED